MQRRKKLSTTVSSDGYALLRNLVRAGKAANLAQAVDLVLSEFRRSENRRRLEQATARYYEEASSDALDEENALAATFQASASEINVDE
jgi:hypothetical protein